MVEITPTQIVRESPFNRVRAWRVSNMTQNDWAQFDFNGYAAVWFGIEAVNSGTFAAGDLKMQDTTGGVSNRDLPEDIAGMYYAPQAQAEMGFLRHPSKDAIVTHTKSGLDIDVVVVAVR